MCFGNAPVGQQSLIRRFMKGPCRLQPACQPLIPSWDLPIVLEALSGLPFELLECSDLKVLCLSYPVAGIDISQADKWITCFVCAFILLAIFPECRKVMLCSNHAFVPKVSEPSYSCTLELLLPKRAIGGLIHSVRYERYTSIWTGLRELGIRTSSFASWASSHRGKPLSHQSRSHWVVEAIILAYENWIAASGERSFHQG